MATLNTIDALMKLNYGTADRIQRCLGKDFPTYTKIKKKTGAVNASGQMLVAPVIFSNVQSMAGTLATAQTVAATSGGSMKSKRWTVPFGDYSAAVTFERKMLKLSASDMGCYIDAKKEEIKSMYRQWAAIFSWYLLNTKGRSLGQFTISSGLCTPVNPEDIVNISPGMVLQASANSGDSGADTLLGSGSLGYVINVNPNAPTFTVATSDGGSAATPSSWTGTMHAFRYGDFGGSGATVICDGFGDWCPASDPSATPFNNIDRTAHITALSGVRIPTAELTLLNNENRIKRLITRMVTRGFGPPKWISLSPDKWQDVADGLESRGLRTSFGKDAEFGYDTINVTAGGVTVPCIAEKFQPSTAIYAWGEDCLVLHNPEEFPAVVNDDGLEMLRKANTNDFELRLQAYPATLGIPGLMGRCPAA